ncbi:alpha/beta hydrolase [Oceanicoccus sp. KOV_DT_Chl]|uniref:alpha/beta hydrolase n=1 Tax=Oceanicoccus sp. KOV_DT_Chl TaxID=1904639 RepID=UPI000C7B9404|nr:alpha/beta hydrolase [Oceanicoccus sp. KOV_DT_Chl]
MAKHHYPIHPDFEKFPVITLSFNRVIIGLLNSFMKLECFFSQRQRLKRAKQHTLTNGDGSQFKVLQFTPQRDSNEKLPAVLIFHGGAFALTYGSVHLYSAEYIAEQANCAVFFVDYRLAHKAPFPAGFNDCYSTLEWVHSNAEQLNIDTQRIAVLGDSAGGGLAAGVAQRALDEGKINVCGQVLVYPTLDHHCQSNTATTYVDTPLWNATNNRRMWRYYLRDYNTYASGEAGIAPSYAAPGGREDLTALPETYLETAEFDPLCDEGLTYARRLIAASITTELNETKGTIHGYDSILSNEISIDAFQRRIAFLTRVFER